MRQSEYVSTLRNRKALYKHEELLWLCIILIYIKYVSLNEGKGRESCVMQFGFQTWLIHLLILSYDASRSNYIYV